MRPWILLWIGLGKSELMEVIELVQCYLDIIVILWMGEERSTFHLMDGEIDGCYHVPGHIGSKDWDWEDMVSQKEVWHSISLLTVFIEEVHPFNKIFVEHLLQARHCANAETMKNKADLFPVSLRSVYGLWILWQWIYLHLEVCSLCGQRYTLEQSESLSRSDVIGGCRNLQDLIHALVGISHVWLLSI